MTLKRILMRNNDDGLMVEFTSMKNKKWYHSDFDAYDMEGNIIKMCSDTDNLEGYLNTLKMPVTKL